MHVYVIWPLFWMAMIINGMNMRHRRRMERMRLKYGAPQQLVAPQPGLSGAERRELEDLRERVRVLERIATDKSSRLADEIESLRD